MAKISRRASMVAALLTGAPQPVPAAIAPAPDSDSLVVNLGRQLLEIIAEEERLVAPYYRLVRFSYPPDVAARLKALAQQQATLRQQIAALPVTTTAGLRTKASVVMLWLAPDGDALVDNDDPDAQLAWSLCRDLLGGGA